MSTSNPAPKPQGPSPADKLLKLAKAYFTFFHDENGDPYAAFQVNGHIENMPMRSRAFREKLASLYYAKTGKTTGTKSLEGVLLTLCAWAADEPGRKVFLRVGHANGCIYVDLANDLWQVIEIGPVGWKVMDSSPVMFRRNKWMEPLPIPEPGGSIDYLRPFLNYGDEKNWVMLVSCMLAAYSSGPYPVENLVGQQGSAKTTTTRVQKRLIDPSRSDTRARPKDEQDLMVAALSSWVLPFDNLSGMPDWFSDAICRLATGGSFGTRQLYTDDEEKVLFAKRPVIVNGIPDNLSRGDLANRAVHISLPAISETQRQPEKQFWADFEKAEPYILGAIYDILSYILAHLHDVQLTETPRMADFAIWIAAAEPALGWKPGTFMGIYTENQEQLTSVVLENSIIATVLIEWFDSLKTPNGKHEWQGTAQELLECFINQTIGTPRQNEILKLSPNGLGTNLRRLLPSLKSEGIEIEFHEAKKINGRTKRLMTIREILQAQYTNVNFTQQAVQP